MSEVKLLPCPLCAGPADHRHWGFGEAEASGITCPNCGLVLEDQPDGEVLISVWNTRANLAELQREVEGLRAEVERLSALLGHTEHSLANIANAQYLRAERLAEALREAFKAMQRSYHSDDSILFHELGAVMDVSTELGIRLCAPPEALRGEQEQAALNHTAAQENGRDLVDREEL